MIYERNKTVCFSGHRIVRRAPRGDLFSVAGGTHQANSVEVEGPVHDPVLYEELRVRLYDVLEKLCAEGYDTFLCGMAEGFDLLAGEAVCVMKRSDPRLRLIACVPFPGQARFFSGVEKERYDRVLESADEVVAICEKYRRECFYMRNDFMVEKSGVLVCWYSGQKGGTAYTVRGAIRNGLKIINLC